MRNCTLLLIGLVILACAGLSAQQGPPARELPLTRAALVHAAPAEHAGAADLDLEKIEKEYGRAVVKILFTYIENLDEIKDDPRLNESFGGYDAHGSGFFINEAGYILTNAHVVDNANRRTIRCRTQATGNSEFELELIGVGETNNVDLALLRLKASEKPRFLKMAGFAGIPFLAVADSDRVAKTEQIAIMGYPEDSDDLRAKAANLSGRQYLDCPFQYLEVATASAVKSGNSGGAAVNRWGEVIGMPARGDWTDSTGWLIPTNVLMRYFDEVAQNEQGRRELEILTLGLATERTFPGMAVLAGLPADFVDFEVGVAVYDTLPGSLAREWGLLPGDLVLSFRNVELDINAYLDFEAKVKTTGRMARIEKDGRTWDNTDALNRTLEELVKMSRAGQTVELTYARKGVPGIKTVGGKLAFRRLAPIAHLGVYEVPDFVEWAGMIVQDIHDRNLDPMPYIQNTDMFKEGMVIQTYADGGSLSDEMGISQYIYALNGKRVRNLAEFCMVIAQINAAYDAWIASAGYVEEQARYDARSYVVVEYYVEDELEGCLSKREAVLPLDKARQTGTSLDPIEAGQAKD